MRSYFLYQKKNFLNHNFVYYTTNLHKHQFEPILAYLKKTDMSHVGTIARELIVCGTPPYTLGTLVRRTFCSGTAFDATRVCMAPWGIFTILFRWIVGLAIKLHFQRHFRCPLLFLLRRRRHVVGWTFTASWRCHGADPDHRNCYRCFEVEERHFRSSFCPEQDPGVDERHV
jgi:hypothetical protein